MTLDSHRDYDLRPSLTTSNIANGLRTLAERARSIYCRAHLPGLDQVLLVKAVQHVDPISAKQTRFIVHTITSRD